MEQRRIQPVEASRIKALFFRPHVCFFACELRRSFWKVVWWLPTKGKMKYFSTSSTFDHPWREVAIAFWNRYPNPKAAHILSEDTIFRKVVGHLMYSKRCLVKTNRLPKWGERITSAKQVAVVEESIVDRLNQSLVTYTRNIGHYSGILTVEEKCTYTIDPGRNDRTLVRREAWIDAHFRGFSSVIQRFALERFKHNCSNASKGFVFILNKLFPKEMVSSVSDISESSIPNPAAVGKSITSKVHDKFDEKVAQAGKVKFEKLV